MFCEYYVLSDGDVLVSDIVMFEGYVLLSWLLFGVVCCEGWLICVYDDVFVCEFGDVCVIFCVDVCFYLGLESYGMLCWLYFECWYGVCWLLLLIGEIDWVVFLEVVCVVDLFVSVFVFVFDDDVICVVIVLFVVDLVCLCEFEVECW